MLFPVTDQIYSDLTVIETVTSVRLFLLSAKAMADTLVLELGVVFLLLGEEEEDMSSSFFLENQFATSYLKE